MFDQPDTVCLPPDSETQPSSTPPLRLVSYNIHKGVQGLGPAQRLEIHNLSRSIEALNADIVCLQEVHLFNHKAARRFVDWPEQAQADFLLPPGYQAVYRSNAVTRHGEHGNALLTRWPIVACKHADISDHRFEQRGVLHVQLHINDKTVHALVVHLGLLPSSRLRQTRELLRYIELHIPGDERVLVAGDFNEWGQRLSVVMAQAGFKEPQPRALTYPSRMPMGMLDRVYARGLHAQACAVPQGRIWRRMSDHLPLITDWQWHEPLMPIPPRSRAQEVHR